MKLFVVSVLDVAAQAYGRPAFFAALGAASRSFVDEVNRSGDPNNLLFSHPEDFQFFHLGEFDDNSGRMTSLDTPVLLMHGSAAKQL